MEKVETPFLQKYKRCRDEMRIESSLTSWSRSSCLRGDAMELVVLQRKQRMEDDDSWFTRPINDWTYVLFVGPTLLAASLGRRYYITSCRKIIRSITHNCVVCRRSTIRPKPQLQGQLPAERITPDSVFERVGLDYAGPFLLKYGSMRKPTIVKAYVCIFVSLTVKAVHLELASDLTTDTFIAALRRFIARRGKPRLIWSDHGTNFVGAVRAMQHFIDFFQDQKTQGVISEFCAMQNIVWKFIPERTPHFGGLWEAAVKSMKTHLKRTIGDTKLTFEEFATILTQIEACLNSRPLTPLPCDDDTVEPLTPGHFLIGRPLQALPDSAESYRSMSLLRRWHLCQLLIRHFWKRWSSEYIDILSRFNKWHFPTRNLQIDDIVVIQEDNLVPTKWPLGRIIKAYPGKDSLVRVVDVRTSCGVYKRPVHKIALLLANENWTFIVVISLLYYFYVRLRPSGLGRRYVGCYIIVTHTLQMYLSILYN